MSTSIGGSNTPQQQAAPAVQPKAPGTLRRFGHWVRSAILKRRHPAFYIVTICILVLMMAVQYFINLALPRVTKEEEATVRYVVNPSEIPKDAQVQRVVFEWNPAGKFYLTSSIVLEEGDYILERSNGLIHWTSDPIADKRGYLQVTPCGVDDLMPFQLKSKTQMNLYLAKEASVACLIGVVGPRPVFDDETGIAWVRGGSRHFGMRSECAVQVTKLPKGKNYLSMAVNDLWTVGDMANNVGTWYIEVQVFRPKKA